LNHPFAANQQVDALLHNCEAKISPDFTKALRLAESPKILAGVRDLWVGERKPAKVQEKLKFSLTLVGKE
jgi:hypothetical protein